MKSTLVSTVVLAAALALVSACKKDEAGGDTPAKDDKKTPVAAKTTDTKPDTPKTPDQPAVKADTPEGKLARFKECWAMFAAKDPKFQDCYAATTNMEVVGAIPEAKATTAADAFKISTMWQGAFPDMKNSAQLVMINGDKFAAIVHQTGTNSGELMGMPATNKTVSAMEGQVGMLNAEGKVLRDLHFNDDPTIMHQLGIMKSERSADEHKPWASAEEALAKGDETETKNVELVKAGFESISKKDEKAMLALYADDAVFNYMPEKGELKGKEAFGKGLKEYFGMSSELKVEVSDAWAAGDWVVAEANSTGVMAVDLPVPGAKTKGKKFNTRELHFFNVVDGKVKRHYVFENSIAMAAQLGLFDPSKMAPGAAKGGDAPAKGARAPAKGAKAPAKKAAKKEEGGW